MSRPQILVVDDEHYVGDLFKASLAEYDCDVTVEHSGFRAMKRVHEAPYDLIFMDIMMPGLNGVRTVAEIMQIRADARVILVTGYTDDGLVQEALANGALACLHKPIGVDTIRQHAEAVAGARRLPKESLEQTVRDSLEGSN